MLAFQENGLFWENVSVLWRSNILFYPNNGFNIMIPSRLRWTTLLKIGFQDQGRRARLEQDCCSHFLWSSLKRRIPLIVMWVVIPDRSSYCTNSEKEAKHIVDLSTPRHGSWSPLLSLAISWRIWKIICLLLMYQNAHLVIWNQFISSAIISTNHHCLQTIKSDHFTQEC